MRIALYPGSFDPVTKGHVDVATRAAAMFDRLIVGVFDAPPKNLLFSTEERVELMKKALVKVPNVTVESYNFNDELRTVIMRPWRLSPGRYTLALRSGELVTTTTVAVAAPGQQISIPLPPHVRTEIVLRRQQTAPDRTTAP